MADTEPCKFEFYGQEGIVIGKRIYGRCEDCGSLVRINKPILGGLHICPPEGRKRRA